ncbi:SRPBCC family protein [Microbacterium elymi]|uniref:SRPBCC domain-containing protein n=1 Tax=Microbacterium elymi TaxID=2909587 RepID=A0ABY5NI75_9MICO|nr:SRPBCC domain-containing protein [Microbacterium elymi]UUT34862.1 SRPBCC domain-containing protein [Microbacterium elymi]
MPSPHSPGGPRWTVSASWWWPQWPDTTYQLDVTEGGDYRIGTPYDGVGVSGRYTAVRPGSLLAFTWQWDGEPEIDHITVLFTAIDASTTEVTMVHVSPGRAVGDGFQQGWTDVLDRLPGAVAG